MWVLGAEPGSSARATSTLSHGAISPTPTLYTLDAFCTLNTLTIHIFLLNEVSIQIFTHFALGSSLLLYQ